MLERTAFVGGHNGRWSVLSMSAVQRQSLDLVSHVDVRATASVMSSGPDIWVLEGQASKREVDIRLERRP